MWEWRWLYAPLLTVLFNRTTQEGKIRNSWPWIVSGTYFPSISLLFPFISLFIPVRSWDDSSNPLLSFISLTMGFCQSISSDFIKWRSSSDLTWLAGSLPQPLTGAWLVIYQSTVAFLPPRIESGRADLVISELHLSQPKCLQTSLHMEESSKELLSRTECFLIHYLSLILRPPRFTSKPGESPSRQHKTRQKRKDWSGFSFIPSS